MPWLLALILLLKVGACPGWALPQAAPAGSPHTGLELLRAPFGQLAQPDSTRYRLLRARSARLFRRAAPEAKRVGEQLLAMATRRGDWAGSAAALYQLVVYCEQGGDYVSATSYSQQGAELASRHQLPDRWRFTQCLGLLAVDTKDEAAGLRYLRRACREQGAVSGVSAKERGGLLLNLANVFLVRQEHDSVLHYALRALPHMQRAGDARGLGYVYQFKGEVYAQQPPHTPARLDSAAANMGRSLRIMQQGRFPSQATASALGLARIYRQQCHPLAAQRLAGLALRLARQLQAPEYQADALESLAWAAADRGHVARSLALSRQAQDLRDSLFSRDKAQALAQLQVDYDVKLLRQEKRTAEFEQGTQRAQLDSLLLLLGGLSLTLGVGGWQHWRLRRQRVLLARAHEASRQSAAEKEVLLQEIHHRVKNNLQLVSGLLAWQGSTLPEPALIAALEASRARIQSMALVHEFLYQADNLAEVRMDHYLQELLGSLHKAHESSQQNIHLRTDLAPVRMGAKEASTLGLLVNELVSNAYKHAFRGRARGCLHVSFASRPTGFQLTVVDDGSGMPSTGAPSKAHSLGLQLVRTLTKQLKATLSATPSLPTGTHVEVTRE